jgi:aldehyde:ferredoxin oxidoreductase
MVDGWTGKRLRVDLGQNAVKVEEIDEPYRKKWLGGRGFNSELLYRETGPDTDPLGADNRLIFGVGPLTGTFAPSSGRTTVTAKSPLGGGFGDSSMGGH